jgi:hypothetical protein
MKGRPCTEPECKDLGPLVWVRLHGAKSPAAKPLNPTPDPERGNIRITVTGGVEEGRVLSGDELAWAKRNGEDLFLSHFVTCAGSAKYRQKKQGSLPL